MSAEELQLSRRKQFAFAAVLVVGFFLLLEIGSRVVHFAVTGSRWGFYYGLPPALNRDATHLDGYYKYRPNQVLHQMDVDPPIPTTINNHGFRGKDFETEKPPGVVRILALGGSSTYGYEARDDYTYPALLEELLNARGDGTYEVLNLGIPHYRSSNLLALLRGEGIDYGPDVVTVYSAYNDASMGTRRVVAEPLGANVARQIFRRSFFVSLVGEPLKDMYNASRGRPKQQKAEIFRVGPEEVEALIADIGSQYRENLEAIVALSRERGFALLFVRQPATSRHQGKTRVVDHMAYAAEVELLRRALEEEGELWRDEAYLLVHADLLAILEDVATQHGIPMVDGVAHADAHPDHMVSWVHLSEEGNQSLAETILAGLERSGSLPPARGG